MTRGADLYRLQRLDSQADEMQHRLAEVEAALGESEALQHARRELERTRVVVQKTTLRQRDLELQTQGLLDKISRNEKRLYSGVVKNPKELTDLQADVAALRRRRQRLEDDLLETMIGREEAVAAHAQAQQHLGEIEAQWSADQSDLLAEREELQEGLLKIGQAREELVPKIEADHMASYQDLRRRKAGLAVVEVRDGACGGCGVNVSASLQWQLRQDGLAFCSNCDRIVVRT